MPSQRYFDQCPAFPLDIPISDLLTISMGQLENQSESETFKLFDACCRDGFFMLDLRDSAQGRILIQDAECMFDLARDTMHLDQDELKKYAYKPPQDLLGYKAAGNLKTDDGGMDTTDMYSLGQDDILDTVLPRRTNPPPIEAQRPACGAFFQHAHDAIAIILNALDRQLALPEGTLPSRCSLSKPSATSLRFLLNAPQQTATRKVTFGAHGDIGLITLLFHVAGGLQLLPADNDDDNNLVHGWRFVQPRPGCALVNIGDTLSAWTGGVLRSALHRVVTAPGPQRAVPRLSLAYLVRPAHGESMRRLRGDGIPLLEKGEEEDARTVDEWADERSARFGDGKVHRQRARGRPPVNT